ncbi:spermatogenesis-associated protein 22 [Gouania willdenowi]|uniref:Spermatogenesis associated 22 n=1 Tax=Gouania willdenowi TaxID=441366 RepID=A0A8C5EG16_GOUWI|nr:spermatogenesis-associated protein 22 [Gouania willdenowi]XP_028323427.1 spermatogenesis-associated protein 22 [Gouania willdenowi]XP_028323428.1 spermatogenesis-associated protein 22 [Gouania willdenowi]
MWKRENQQPRPTAGCLSVPLFNQKKRNRIPLTSAPSENEFFSHREYVEPFSSAPPKRAAGGCHQPPSPSSGALQTSPYNRQNTSQFLPSQSYGEKKPAPGPVPAARTYGLMPHPYKAGGRGSMIGQPSNQVKQQDSNFRFNPGQSQYQAPCGSESSQSKINPRSHPYSQQPRPLPALPPPRKPMAPSPQPQKNSWKFTNSFGPQSSGFQGKKSSSLPSNKSQAALSPKPAVENSLRIMTAVIGGMKHWSKFKDRFPCLFEIFATLDSAVTLGRYGAKSFLMRDGKEVVQCIFYENELVLPRLVRGQPHRCVGNYDHSRELLVCVSVRPGLPSEFRNAQDAVKACDAEMRMLVKSLSEV